MEQHADDPKKKRRIPEDLRKRALVSCDRCKKRRVRCLRATSGTGAQQGPCQSCLENGVKCESTLPRKQRIYGSIETLSIRYRVLDALIKGLYPNEDTANIDVLYEIAEKNGIEVPSGNVEVAGEDVLNQAPTPASSQAGATSPAKQQSTDSASFDLSQVNDRSSTETMEEKTLANPQGGPSHYIGPSSSFGFVLAIRDLVAQYNAGSRPGPPATKLPSDFVPPAAKAKLEPIVKKEASAWTTSGDLNGRPHDKKSSGNPPLLQAEVVASYAKRTLSSFLPSRKLTDRMVEAFFDRVHPNYMVLDPRSFYTRYRATWSDSRAIQDVEAGWTCVLFMVVVFGAQALEQEDKDQSVELQRRYLSLVLQRQYHLTSTSNLLNLQALLLAQLYQHNNRERNSSWMLLGCATRMMVALGMHHEGSTGGFDSIEREMRRRVWWTTYNVENNLCMILGRPSSINESLINVDLPDETMLDSAACVPLGYLDYSVRLTRLINRVKQEMYDEPEPPSNPTRTHIANRLLVSLEDWYNSLPPQLHPSYISMHSTHNRAVHLLHVQYHHTQTLITRPFILRKVSAQLAFHLGSSPPSLDSGEVTLSHLCCSYARQAVILLHQLSTMGMLDGVAWMDFYYLYHAVLILALDFLARPRDQRDTVEDVARKAAVRDALNAVRNARLCPTFTFLIQVSQQIAKIVGIFDVETTPAPMSYQLPIHASQSQQTIPTPADIQQQAIVEDLINEWFQYDPTNMPWHFFGALGSGELENSNMLVPVMGDMSMNDDGGAGIVYQTGGGGENNANTFVQWNPNPLAETSGYPPQQQQQQQQPRGGNGNNGGGTGGYSNNGMPMGP